MQNSKDIKKNHYQGNKNENEVVLHSNCKDSKFELCKTVLKNILSPTNRPDEGIFKVLKSLQKCKVLIEKSKITNIQQITVNFIKFSEDLSSELYEVSLFIIDIIQCFKIILNDTAKASDLVDVLETSLNGSNKRIGCIEGLENYLDNINNEIRQGLYNSNVKTIEIDKIDKEIDKEVKIINNQFKLLISFWESHKCLIDNLVKLLYDHIKKSTCTLEISKVDYEEIISLWAKVIDKCKTDYLRAKDAIVKGSFHTAIDISNDTGVGLSNIDSDPANINNNGNNWSLNRLVLCSVTSILSLVVVSQVPNFLRNIFLKYILAK
ncbi:2387_t:CDS:2 [Cetraspora pellucida]|uniref:2387_t:CDS:1 n=1 Tax=Cetraspora pellucida TaxID=1433469 RepID=A0A9N8VUQ0_9GLOM|nr:2387_t:CDS:2 [Cetraspora pellucida]